MASRFRSVLLDVDGTIVDSNDAHARAWVESLREAGHRVDFEAVRPLIGMGGDRLLDALLGLPAEGEASRRLRARRREVFAERHADRVRAFPRARELVERMKAEGLGVVVATSSSREDLERLLDVARVKDLVDDVTTADEVETTKPAPDPIEAALRKAGVPPQAAVLLGDTPYDVTAAAHCGVATLAVRCGGWGDDALRGALAIYDDPADLLAHWERSPLAGAPARG